MRILPQKIAIDFTDEQITGSGGAMFLSRVAARLGLGERLSEGIRIKERRRGADDSETLMSLIYCLAQGDGTLSDVDRLGCDEARKSILGLDRVPDSRRAGEYLSRFDDRRIEALMGVAAQTARGVISPVAEHALAEKGYVPLFIDGTAIEVEGRSFEGAKAGYDKTVQYWLHNVFVDRLWTSQTLYEGGVDAAHGWREQLERTADLLRGQAGVWLRADNAYYNKDVAEFCKDHGWNYSVSVTSETYKGPLKKEMANLYDVEWEWINECEQAAWLAHKPSRWKEWETYVVVRTMVEDGKPLLVPRHTFILTSRDGLSKEEVVRRHRQKQGQENAQKGPLIDLDLHHPPCRRFLANRAYYTLGQIAQILLTAAQYLLLPKTARIHGIRMVIRDLIRTAAKLVRHARRWTLLFSKNAKRLDWINHAADRLESLARGPG